MIRNSVADRTSAWSIGAVGGRNTVTIFGFGKPQQFLLRATPFNLGNIVTYAVSGIGGEIARAGRHLP